MVMIVADDFYKKVKEYATRKGYRKIDFFLDEIAIKRSTYYDRQKKNSFPPVETVARLAEVMGVSCDYLITGQDRDLRVNKYNDVLDNLDDMDLQSLENARVMIASLAENCRKKNTETA